MNLILDIGNSRSKIAVFNEGKLERKFALENPLTADVLFALEALPPKGSYAMLASTSIVDEQLLQALSNHYTLLQLLPTTPVPINNHYRTPHTLGRDRLAVAVAAKQLYTGENCLVIDAGTCITYELITAEGDYLGGNISPGVSMRLRAMNTFTAKLPLVERQRLDSDIGYSTETAIRIGAILGTSMEVSGFIAHYEKKLPRLKVLLTGGDAELLLHYFSKNINITLQQDLVLIGLNEILQHNVYNQFF